MNIQAERDLQNGFYFPRHLNQDAKCPVSALCLKCRFEEINA